MNGAPVQIPEMIAVQTGTPIATSGRSLSGRAAAMGMGLNFMDIIQAMLGNNLSNSDGEVQLEPKKLQEDNLTEQFMLQAAQMLIPPAFIQAGIPLLSEDDLQGIQQPSISPATNALFDQGQLTQRLSALLTNLGIQSADTEEVLQNAKAFLNIVEAKFNTDPAKPGQAVETPLTMADQTMATTTDTLSLATVPNAEAFTKAVQEVKTAMGTVQEKKNATDFTQAASLSQPGVDTLAPKQTDMSGIVKTKADSLSKAYDFLNQVTHGLKENLSEGKDRFVIKLKPESLGEITVRLVEEAGKSILRISTANPTTAQLINNDLNALKEAMRPMQIQVETAVSPSQTLSADVSQQFNMANQQFNDRQQQQGQFYHASHQAAYRDDSLDESGSEMLWPKLTKEGVDRYV